MSAHYVYRYYGADDRLLYVGCTKDPYRRYTFHKADSRRWIHEVARGRISVYPSKTRALSAERAAIAQERPLYNRNHQRTAAWGRQDFIDHVAAQIRISPWHDPASTFGSDYVIRIRETYAAKFGEALTLRTLGVAA